MKYLPLIAVLSFFLLANSVTFAQNIFLNPNLSLNETRNETEVSQNWFFRNWDTESNLYFYDNPEWNVSSLFYDGDIIKNIDFDGGYFSEALLVSDAYNQTNFTKNDYMSFSFDYKLERESSDAYPFSMMFHGILSGGTNGNLIFAYMNETSCSNDGGGGEEAVRCYIFDSEKSGYKRFLGIYNLSNLSGARTTNFDADDYLILAIGKNCGVGTCGNLTLDNFELIQGEQFPPASPPVVAIQNPAQDSVIGLSQDFVTYALQYTAESTNIDSCWYSLNGLPNVTMPACANGTGYPNLNPYDLENQTMNSVTVYANDTSGNIGSATSTFNVSIVHPTVYIIVPNGNYNVDAVLFIQAPAGWRNQCGFRIDNESLNMSIGCTNGNIWLPQGNHNITAQIWNYQGNYGNGTASFFVDSILPVVAIQNPTGSYTGTIPLDFTVDESNPDSCWYSIDDAANVSLASCSNATFSSALGTHNVTVYANDTLNNIGSDAASFTKASIPHTGMVTGATAGIYVLFPILLGVLIMIFAIYMLMSGNVDVKEAAIMIIVSIIMIIAATSIMASFL